MEKPSTWTQIALSHLEISFLSRMISLPSTEVASEKQGWSTQVRFSFLILIFECAGRLQVSSSPPQGEPYERFNIICRASLVRNFAKTMCFQRGSSLSLFLLPKPSSCPLQKYTSMDFKTEEGCLTGFMQLCILVSLKTQYYFMGPNSFLLLLKISRKIQTWFGSLFSKNKNPRKWGTTLLIYRVKHTLTTDFSNLLLTLQAWPETLTNIFQMPLWSALLGFFRDRFSELSFQVIF